MLDTTITYFSTAHYILWAAGFALWLVLYFLLVELKEVD